VTPRVVFRPEALAELLQARRWYDERLGGLGAEFAHRWKQRLKPFGGVQRPSVRFTASIASVSCAASPTQSSIARPPLRSSLLQCIIIAGPLPHGAGAPFDINFEVQHALASSRKRVSKNQRKRSRRGRDAHCGAAALRMGDKLWDPVGKGLTAAGRYGLLSPRGWRLLAGPGVRWRSLTVLVRLLISRFSIRFRVGASRMG
jgi:hypothetical protein